MEDLLNQEIKVYNTPGAPDPFGKQTWGGFETVPCRFVKTFRHYKDNQGNESAIRCKFQVSESRYEIGTKVEYLGKPYLLVECKDWVDEDGELFGSLLYCADYPSG